LSSDVQEVKSTKKLLTVVAARGKSTEMLLIPPPNPRRFCFPGRKPVDNRQALTGILFVLKSGTPWKMLPQEMASGSGMTCWRRLRDWQAAGVWQRLHEVLLAELDEARLLDWSRATSY
jgi:transposase